MGVTECYTLETSLYGYYQENGEIRHFDEKDLYSLAKSLIQSIFVVDSSS
jgi:hypothetical protein